MNNKTEEKYKKVPLKELLEVIQYNLSCNLDCFYDEAITLIGEEAEHALRWKKEDLKKQIKEYLKIVTKNVIYYIEHNHAWSKYLNEAVKDK